MSFYVVLVFAVFFLCSGGACGCLACVAAGKISRKAFLKARISITYILLSASIVSLPAGAVFIGDIRSQFAVLSTYSLFFFCIFVCGLVCGCFLRTVLPFFLATYILFASSTGTILYKAFGSMSDRMPVVVSNNSLSIGGKVFYADSPQNRKIAVNAYVLPAILVVPLPRVWYSVSDIADSGKAELGETKSLAEPATRYLKWLLADKRKIIVDLPSNDLLPAVYTLNFKIKEGRLVCGLSKNL